MEIAQSFTVAHAPARVWAFLGDPHAVAACLAGAQVTRVDEDGALAGSMTVRFGPIQASFAGKGKLERDDSAMTGRIEGQGLDSEAAPSVRVESTMPSPRQTAARRYT